MLSLLVAAIVSAGNIQFSAAAGDIDLPAWQYDAVLNTPFTSRYSAGTLGIDLSNTHATCTATGTPPTFGADGVDLNGTSDYIDCGDDGAFSPTDGAGNDQPMSACIWANMDDATSFRFFDKDDAGANREFQFATTATDQPRVILFTDGSNFLRVTADSPVTGLENQWAMFCFTYDGVEDGSGIVIYINGSSVASTISNAGTHTGVSDTTAPLWIGRVSTIYSDGTVYGGLLWNVERTASEMADINACGVTGCNVSMGN